MAREARNHVGATTPACGGPHETGAWEEASASAAGYAAHARQHARAPGALRRSQRRGLSGCSPGVPSLEAPSRGVLSDPAAASRNGNAVRSLIGTAIGEQRSIFQAVPGQETDPQHSAVRTLASRTTPSVCRRRAIAGNGFQPPVMETLTAISRRLTGVRLPRSSDPSPRSRAPSLPSLRKPCTFHSWALRGMPVQVSKPVQAL